jgi:hypothetical protein
LPDGRRGVLAARRSQMPRRSNRVVLRRHVDVERVHARKSGVLAVRCGLLLHNRPDLPMNIASTIHLIRVCKATVRQLRAIGEFHARAHFERLIDELERELLAHAENGP